MKDITEFKKLFNITIPVDKYFDYYIKTLSKSPEYFYLETLVNEFEEFEKFIELSEYKKISDYKMSYCFKTILNNIENSEAYKNFEKFNIFEKLPDTVDSLKLNLDKDLISIDLKSANYNILKYFDQNNFFPDEWYDYVISLGIHPIIAKSKSFRQLIFGNLNPKKTRKLQLMFLGKMLKHIPIENIVSVYADEIILNKDINIMGFELPLRKTYFSLHKKEDIYYKNINHEYIKLMEVPSNKFFKRFKQIVLCEDIVDEDLYFVVDGDIAKWT